MDEIIKIFKILKPFAELGAEQETPAFSTVAALNITTMLATEVAAKALNVRPNTIRSSLCKRGHYMGLRPVKLPSGRLLWSAEAIEHLLTTGEGF